MRERAAGPRATAAAVSDAAGSTLPIADLVERIDPDVVSALARWREVDPLSLHGLGEALTTRTGDAALDHASYLTALHGFVAERITYNTLLPHNDVIFPAQTNVPAYDLLVNGEPVQIKEGTTAFETVQRALHRYPQIDHFATDPQTAAQLKARGIDAIGIPGLEPAQIASETHDSLIGLNALERSGAIHLPVLTTVFALCRYWERFDSGRVDARTAAIHGTVDIGAQALGSALGLKLAAVCVVALGGFGLAALPLSAGAIVGSLGLRHLVNTQRITPLQRSFAELDTARSAAELATQIVIDISADYVDNQWRRATLGLDQRLSLLDFRWITEVDEAAVEAINDLDSICLAALRDVGRSAFAVLERRLHNTRTILESTERAAALYKLLDIIVRTMQHPSDDLYVHLALGSRRAEQRAERLLLRRSQLQRDAEQIVASTRRELHVDLVAEYALLLERLSQIAARIITVLDTVRLEAEKLGADWQTIYNRTSRLGAKGAKNA